MVVKELEESQYLKITKETIRAAQEASAAKSLTPGHDPNNFINEVTRPRNVLPEMEEPIYRGQTPRRHRYARLTEEYRDAKLITWKDLDFDLSSI